MAVKLELYKVFKEVAEAGNITAAAVAGEQTGLQVALQLLDGLADGGRQAAV